MLVRGIASSLYKEFTSTLGKSPGTELDGFLYFLILLATSSSKTWGISTLFALDSGLSPGSSSLAWLVMLVKCLAKLFASVFMSVSGSKSFILHCLGASKSFILLNRLYHELGLPSDFKRSDSFSKYFDCLISSVFFILLSMRFHLVDRPSHLKIFSSTGVR